jgi:hypothetical protein
MNPIAIRLFAALAITLGTVAGVLVAPRLASTSAQEATPCPEDEQVDAQEETTPEPVVSSQRVLAVAEFSELPQGPAQLSAVQLTLAPQSQTQPFNLGPVLILVQEGTVVLDADLAAVGLPQAPSVGGVQLAGPEPTPADGLEVAEDNQIALPAGTTAQLRNLSDVPARLLMISLAPTT